MHIDNFDDHRHTVTTRTGAVSYIDIGSGVPAVFVHGVGTSAYLWRNVIATLDGTRRTIALDLPLHGQSPAAADQDFTLGALADGLLAFCDALALDEIDLVAERHGARLRRSSRLGIPIACARSSSPTAKRTTTCRRRRSSPQWTWPRPAHSRRARPSCSPISQYAPRGRVRDGLRGSRVPQYRDGRCIPGTRDRDTRAAGAELRALPRRARSDRSPRGRTCARALTVPTLVVWGNGDAFFETRWAYWLPRHHLRRRGRRRDRGRGSFFPDEPRPTWYRTSAGTGTHTSVQPGCNRADRRHVRGGDLVVVTRGSTPRRCRRRSCGRPPPAPRRGRRRRRSTRHASPHC